MKVGPQRFIYGLLLWEATADDLKSCLAVDTQTPERVRWCRILSSAESFPVSALGGSLYRVGGSIEELNNSPRPRKPKSIPATRNIPECASVHGLMASARYDIQGILRGSWGVLA